MQLLGRLAVFGTTCSFWDVLQFLGRLAVFGTICSFWDDLQCMGRPAVFGTTCSFCDDLQFLGRLAQKLPPDGQPNFSDGQPNFSDGQPHFADGQLAQERGRYRLVGRLAGLGGKGSAEWPSKRPKMASWPKNRAPRRAQEPQDAPQDGHQWFQES